MRRSRFAVMTPAGRAGRLVAAADLPFTFTRTLMPRPTSDQAVITGLAFSTNTAVAELVQESVHALAWIAAGRARSDGDATRWTRTSLRLDVAAMLAGVALQRMVPWQAREPLGRAAVRTAGYWLAQASAAGALSGGVGELVRGRGGRMLPTVAAGAGAALMGAEVGRRLRRQGAESLARGAVEAVQSANVTLPTGVAADDRLKALAMGLGAAGVLAAIGAGERRLASALAAALARALPGDEALWQPVGHAAVLAGLGLGAKHMVERTLDRIEHGETGFEAAFDIPPPNSLLSGSHASLVDFSTLSRQGRRFVWTVTTKEQIEQVLGEPARDAPIRAYVGLESAADDDARVKLLVAELDRAGAFDREWLLVACPTGTGYVNYAASGAFEILTRGDCATASIQYSARPSVLSLDRVRNGRRVYRAFFAALRDRLEQIPEGSRPKVVVFGESLGSWASQDAFNDRGTAAMVDHGIDYAIWIGTPYFSKWKEQVLYDDRPDVDLSLIAVCSSIDEWHALGDDARQRARYVMVTHHNDGVALFGPPLGIQEPPWLADRSARAEEVPVTMNWMPTTTFLQVLVDMKNSTNVTAGRFDDNGHDYRGSLVPFFHAVLDLPASAEQLDALQGFLEDRELQRTQWIKSHAGVGASMAARVVAELYREAEARGEDPDARLMDVVRRIASEDFAAAGGTAPD